MTISIKHHNIRIIEGNNKSMPLLFYCLLSDNVVFGRAKRW